MNWPEDNAAATSGGQYLMETVSVHQRHRPRRTIRACGTRSTPGPARFYVLTAAWADGNIGTGSVYQNDRDAHWTPSSAEYQWLQNDLAAHPNALKFAFWHYPLYADSSGQPSDTFLQGGPGTLQGLLDQNNVAIVFNGHAHGYERNKPDSAGLVSYVFGNGGAALGSVSGCSTLRPLRASAPNGSHCGAAPAGLSNDHVFGFAKVTVNGRQVTVTPDRRTGPHLRRPDLHLPEQRARRHPADTTDHRDGDRGQHQQDQRLAGAVPPTTSASPATASTATGVQLRRAGRDDVQRHHGVADTHLQLHGRRARRGRERVGRRRRPPP